MKNLIVVCIAVLMWWMVGYGLAFADVKKFIGNDGWYFASAAFEKFEKDNYVRFIYELAFCILVCVLFTGPLAERTRMVAYCGYAFLLSGYIYPVIVAWVWGSGWLAQKGFHDFSGAGVVHLVAGVSGFWGALFVGKRYGKDFSRNKPEYILSQSSIEKIVGGQKTNDIPYSLRNLAYRDDFRPSNQVNIVCGTLLFWAFYLFFTGGKTYTMYNPRANNVAKIFMNTFLSAAACGIFSLLVKPLFVKTYRHVSWYDAQSIANGILAGLVSISAVADRVEGWAAVSIGLIGALFYISFCKLLQCTHIDDGIEGIAVHMGGGIWGLLAAGFFDNTYGVFYSDPAKGHYFGYQVCGIVVIFAWTSCFAATYFLVMRTFNLLRLDMCYEVAGYDTLEMGGINEADMLKIHEDLRYRLAADEKRDKEMMIRAEASNLAKVAEIKELLRDKHAEKKGVV